MFDLALTYGMTPEQYWNCDPEMYYNYKNAYENRRKLKEQDIWSQAAYFKCAIEGSVQAVSGITDFKKHKFTEFPKCPHIEEKDSIKELTEQQLENERLKTYAFFKSFAKRR
jgi:hypothetical protein